MPQFQRESLEEYADRLDSRERLTTVVGEALTKAAVIRGQHDRVIYLAGALTGMTSETKRRYADVSALLSTFDGPGNRIFGYAPHLHGTDPVAHPHVTPEEVRDVDYIFAALVPDYHINFFHPTAHGNAIEEGWAEMHDIPSLFVAPRDVRLSRLVLGMHNINGILPYVDFDTDGLAGIRSHVEGLVENDFARVDSRQAVVTSGIVFDEQAQAYMWPQVA